MIKIQLNSGPVPRLLTNTVSASHTCAYAGVCLCFSDNLSLDIHLHVGNDFRSLKPISHSLGSEESLHSLAVL